MKTNLRNFSKHVNDNVAMLQTLIFGFKRCNSYKYTTMTGIYYLKQKFN